MLWPYIIGLLLVAAGEGLVQRSFGEGVAAGLTAVVVWLLVAALRPERAGRGLGRAYVVALLGVVFVLAAVLVYATLI